MIRAKTMSKDVANTVVFIRQLLQGKKLATAAPNGCDEHRALGLVSWPDSSSWKSIGLGAQAGMPERKHDRLETGRAPARSKNTFGRRTLVTHKSPDTDNETFKFKRRYRHG